MGGPFEVSAEGMQDHDESGSEIFGFIHGKKHTGNNAVDSMKKTVKQGAVMKKKIPEVFINGKHTVPMSGINQFKSHTGSAFHGVFVAAGGTKAAVAAKGNKFKVATMGAGIHCTTEGRIAAA